MELLYGVEGGLVGIVLDPLAVRWRLGALLAAAVVVVGGGGASDPARCAASLRCSLARPPACCLQGSRQPNAAAGVVVGIVKGFVGLPGRPLVGVLEGTSRVLQALALVALGREGIVGKMQVRAATRRRQGCTPATADGGGRNLHRRSTRAPDAPCSHPPRLQRRVRAPGAFSEDGVDAVEDGPRSEAQLALRALMAAWQRVLPDFFPAMAEDIVKGERGCRARLAEQHQSVRVRV